MITRKGFIQQAAIISTGIILSPSLVLSKPRKKIGLQLYTLRDSIGKDVSGVIEKVAKVGYDYVETYGYTKESKYWGLDPKAFNSLLKANNLKAPSGHYGLDLFLSTGKDEELKSYIDAANIVEHTYITVPYLGAKIRENLDDYKKIAHNLNKAGEICKRSGLKLAYHNHDFEFKQFDKGNGFDILLNETDPSLVGFELDLYWVVRGGHDPISLFKKNPGRFVMWHVKDMDKLNPKMNTEIGNGSINFKTIFDNVKASGAKYMFVEQENNYVPEPFASIAKSAKYIKKDLFLMKLV
ncbi:MAG TPA: sugar phosphate isomerase/epimerase [Sphingobacteriaceae bacterium]|nr:sugar phosphate isomerase/epimerase [Sphingobacteriaceae bacterium]